VLTLWAAGTPPPGTAPSRRNFLSVGTLALGGLSLADLLRLEARAAAGDPPRQKSVIFVYLPGGPSHIDLYDMKPDAPAEIRGEFKPIKTNVPGIEVCELLALQAKIANRFAIVRGFQTTGGHDSRMLTTGFKPGAYRPAFGSVVSKLHPGPGTGLPPYVTLVQETNLPFGQDPAYLGPAHAPFALRGKGLADLSPPKGMTLDRLDDREGLRRDFDTMRRDLDAHQFDKVDAHTARALDMVRSSQVRDAFDLSREPEKVRAAYGTSPGTLQFLMARRLVEAGARVVTLYGGWVNNGSGDSPANLSNWDTHEDNFGRLRVQAPHLDRALYALLTDLAQRGLDQDVVVVAAGEMGRGSGSPQGPPTRRTAATTGRRGSPWWPAEASPRARSSARPTGTPTGRGAGRSRRKTCWPPCTICSASTRRRPSPTTPAAPSSCSTTATGSTSCCEYAAYPPVP
jgi:hypothetical protein